MRRLFSKFTKEKHDKAGQERINEDQQRQSSHQTDVPQTYVSSAGQTSTTGTFDPRTGGIHRSGNGYDLEAEARTARFVSQQLGDEARDKNSLLEANLRYTAQQLGDGTGTARMEKLRREMLGLEPQDEQGTAPEWDIDDDTKWNLEQQRNAKAYSVPEEALTMGEFVLSQMAGGSSMKDRRMREMMEVPHESLPTIPWPFGNQCTFTGDSICAACAKAPLHRMMVCKNLESRASIFRLADVKMNATIPGCPLCRLLLATFRESTMPMINVEKPSFGENTVIRLWMDDWVSLMGVGSGDNRTAIRHLGSSKRFYAEMTSGVLCDIRKDAFECKSMLLPDEVCSFGFQLMEVAHPEDQREYRWFGNGRPISEVVDTSLLQTWISQCLLKHGPACGVIELRPYHLGFRLIDVERRCVVDAVSPTWQYVALSYPWGQSPQPPQLLNILANRERFSQPGGLDDSHADIPQTIKDVVTLCSRIHLQYLWIDALCIHQDDPSDQQAQIGNMDQVYSRAIMTIVAASTETCNDSLAGVQPGSRSFVPTTEIIEGIHLAPFAEPFRSSIIHSLWETRGWTLQEKLLSHRMLVITPTQMFWKCAHGTWYEDACLETTIPHNIKAENRWEFSDNESAEPLERYRSVAKSFLFRDFSDQKDGLNAIKGINNKLSGGLGSAFHCGIPERFLAACVLWEWPGIYNRMWLPRMEHFASWSWVSLSIDDNIRKVKDDHAPVLWDAVTSETEYTDSHVRVRLGKYPKIVSLVQYYRFNPSGDPVRIASSVLQANDDPQFQAYLQAHDLPWTDLPMLPLRFFQTPQEYITLARELKTNPTAHCIFPHGVRSLLSRMLGFCARIATLYISPITTALTPPPSPDPQPFTVSLDSNHTQPIGTITLDNWHRATLDETMEFVAVARHVSSGPHSTLPKQEGWYFQCLAVEKAFDEAGIAALGAYAEMVYRKVGVLFDVHCGDWEAAGPKFGVVMLI